MSLNTTPRTFVAGEVETAAIFNVQVRDAFTGIQAAWDSYTPVATNFTVGNGAIRGRYLRVGKSLMGLRVAFGGGSTSTYTGSQMTVSLPAAVHGTDNQYIPLRLSSVAGQLSGWAEIAQGASVATLTTQTSTANDALIPMTNTSPNPGTAGFFVFETGLELA